MWKLNSDKKLKPEIGLWSWAIWVEVWANKDQESVREYVSYIKIKATVLWLIGD